MLAIKLIDEVWECCS